MSWEVQHPRTGETISRHRTEAAALRAIARSHASAGRRLNRPGLHGGIEVSRFVERVVVYMGAVSEPTTEAKNGTTSVFR